jgi:UTP--glucose-1-phosphate uridylyltransferase
VVALGDSIIGLNARSDIVRRMAEKFTRSKADGVIAFETVPREDVMQYGCWWKNPCGSCFATDVLESSRSQEFS